MYYQISFKILQSIIELKTFYFVLGEFFNYKLRTLNNLKVSFNYF
jgi:hypothetical protein